MNEIARLALGAGLAVALGACAGPPGTVDEATGEVRMFDFESGFHRWGIPPWAHRHKSFVASGHEVDDAWASHGERSLAIPVAYPEAQAWYGVYIEASAMFDATRYETLSIDLRLPEDVEGTFDVSLGLTVGEQSSSISLAEPATFAPGEVATLTVELGPDGRGWQQDDAPLVHPALLLSDVRGMNLTIGLWAEAPGRGTIRVDNIRLCCVRGES